MKNLFIILFILPMFLFSDENQLQFPHMGMDNFYYDSNCEFDNTVPCQTLNTLLPFKPDILLIQRERWQPEQSIIHEFKVCLR